MTSKVSLRYFVRDCIHFSQLLIVSIYQERIMTCPNMPQSWKHMYNMLFLSMISIRKHIFSEIKQFFARMKSKEIGVSNDVKINLSIYVTEKKNVFVEFFKNTTNLDKWWCVIISFEIGLKWNMILFFLEQSYQR